MFAAVINKNRFMKTCNFVKMLTACMLSFLFLSCGDDIVYETIKNTDEGLCDRTWIMQTEQDGAVVRQYKLTFYSKNQKGQELTVTYDEDGKTSVDREFSWRWVDNSKEALLLTFTTGEKVFENVWVREHYLSGRLDGEIIVLTEEGY